MEKYDTWQTLGSYSIDRRLLRSLDDFINTKIPRILQKDQRIQNFSAHSWLTLVGSGQSTVFHPLNSYTRDNFDSDIDVLRIDLQYADEENSSLEAIVMILRLGNSRSDSELFIALQGEKAADRIKEIEQGLLSALAPHKNTNRIVYPNEFAPTLIFILGFFIGIGSLMFVSPFLKTLCLVLFGAAIYFVGRRFTLGYCSFASRRQQQRELFLRWFIVAIVLFVLVAAVLSFHSSTETI